MGFKLSSTYSPTGDQPEAIEMLTRHIRDGVEAATLLGVTGSGKNIYNGKCYSEYAASCVDT